MDVFLINRLHYLMLRVLLFLSLFCLLAFAPPEQPGGALIAARMRYLYQLKTQIDRDTWPGFAAGRYDLPLVYYTDSNCYVGNPTPKFLQRFPARLVAESPGLKIYRTQLIDSIPFHMETGMVLGSDTGSYLHRASFMHCSSPEITRRFISDVTTTELWATMVIHEYFHGYQFRHRPFMDYFEKKIAIGADTLTRVYQAHSWYKNSVDQENRFLLAALQSEQPGQVRAAVDSFFLYRNRRRQQTRQQLSPHLETFERVYETTEGTARYVEFSLYRHFVNKPPDALLQRQDTSYRSYSYFRKHTIDRDPWLYLSEKTHYHYATGFNMARLLDKLQVPYKKRLFRESALSLEDLLRQWQRSQR